MPDRDVLTRANVTRASRIMLPTYPVLALFIGAIYLADPGGRVERAPGLSFARELMSMDLWGMCFLGVASIMVAALLTHRRRAFVFALYLYGAGAIIWSLIYLGATFISPDASFVGPAWPLFVAVACHASASSLMRGEV